jgi:hypothetical protein
VTRFGEVPDADVESGHIVLPMRVVGDVPGCYDVPNLACQLVDASSASYSATRIACTVPAGVGRGFQVCVWVAVIVECGWTIVRARVGAEKAMRVWALHVAADGAILSRS